MGEPAPVSGRLVIVCGLPGAGKTTIAVALEHQLHAVRFSADDWMIRLGIDLFASDARDSIESIQRGLAERLLRLGGRVIIEWGSWARSERDELRSTARAAGAGVELHFVDAPIDVLWQRVQARALEQRRGSRALTRADIVRYAQVFEVPDDAELALYDAPLVDLSAARA